MKLKKQQSNLNRRRHDYHTNIKGGKYHEHKVGIRIDTGGYHCPGSNKK